MFFSSPHATPSTDKLERGSDSVFAGMSWIEAGRQHFDAGQVSNDVAGGCRVRPHYSYSRLIAIQVHLHGDEQVQLARIAQTKQPRFKV